MKQANKDIKAPAQPIPAESDKDAGLDQMLWTGMYTKMAIQVHLAGLNKSAQGCTDLKEQGNLR